MNTTDLLRMCDDVLELSEMATPGPWRACSANREEMGCCPCRLVMDDDAVSIAQAALPSQDDPCKTFNETPVDERKQAAVNMDLIAHSRTALPLLASALKGLLPYMDHSDECEQRILDHEDGEPLPCTCGLSSTLSALEGQASRG